MPDYTPSEAAVEAGAGAIRDWLLEHVAAEAHPQPELAREALAAAVPLELQRERERLRERPGSCTCIAVPGYDGPIQWEDCPYHRAAKERPMDHSIPWNCPTYWDGCNCKAEIDKLRESSESALQRERERWAEELREKLLSDEAQARAADEMPGFHGGFFYRRFLEGELDRLMES